MPVISFVFSKFESCHLLPICFAADVWKRRRHRRNDRLRHKLVLTTHVNMLGMMLIRGPALAYGYIFHHAVSVRTCIVFKAALFDSSKF